jgi:hypothetical protein
MTDWNFMTIAVGHPKWHWAAFRLTSQAKRSNFFSTIKIARLNSDIKETFVPESTFVRRWVGILQGKKALDSYRWKPILIYRQLLKLPQGSGLLYLDAGCEFNLNPESRTRMLEYFKMTSEKSFLTMALKTSLFNNTSDETLSFFEISAEMAKNSPMNQSGIIFMLNNDETRRLVGAWANSAEKNPSLFLNQAVNKNAKQLSREGRHDQSVLSCLMLNMGLSGIADETYFAPDWQSDGVRYPIWALRNSKFKSRVLKSPI